MAQVRTETLANLKCCRCNRYLSYFPIHFESNFGSICGRCLSPQNAIRNVPYEKAMEYSKFPCAFNQEGCIERLIPKDIPQHEKWCKYRTYACPVTQDAKCEWRGMVKDLYDHFEKKHTVFILKTKSFEIDFVNSHKENCLIDFGTDFYIVTRSANSKKNLYSCNVNYVGGNPKCSELLYKLTFKNINGSKEHVIRSKMGEAVEISRKDISNALGDPVSIVVDIDVCDGDEADTMEVDEEAKESSINYEMMKELECLVCFEYMLPPIYQCETGHSICSNCTPQVTQCPNCRSSFKKTQNFALAQLISYLDYPCKYPKCRFVTKATKIKDHETNCIYGTIKCPLKGYVECEALVTAMDIKEHIEKNHVEHLLDTDGVTYPFEEDQEFEDSLILRHGLKLFQMHFFYEDHTLHWYVQLIGAAEESAKYRYEVDVQDNNGGNCRVYFKGKCQALTSKENLSTELANFLEYDQVKDLISSQITFEIRVLEG